MSHIPLRRRPLEKGRGRVYRDRMSGQWFADFRDKDGVSFGVWASDIADGNDWCRSRSVEVRFPTIDFKSLATMRKRQELADV